MFCFQCEQADVTGTVPGCAGPLGSCGKSPEVSDLQDLLLHAATGIAQYAELARREGQPDAAAGEFLRYAVFTTLTNVNFHAARMATLLHRAAAVRDEVRERYLHAVHARGGTPQEPTGPARWQPAPDADGLLAQARAVPVDLHREDDGAEVLGLRALHFAALKGVCAYAHHAHVLGAGTSGGETDATAAEVDAGIEHALAHLAGRPRHVEELLAGALDLGRLGLRTLELLDAANTGAFGDPRPTAVRTTPVPGKAILVSGHDLGDLERVLEATAETGIQVYTHGELLPAHGYPRLFAHAHLAGNYGGAWHDQQREFAAFPGPILMTSNCLTAPHASYRRRLFTTGPVGWPGVRHLADGGRAADALAPLLDAAAALPGFDESVAADEPRYTTVGFGQDACLAVVDEVAAAVRDGTLRHLFLVGGCDGPTAGRDYYRELALGAPDDTVVLTLGCAKYRFNHEEFGTVGGIPRLLDLGQCNDAFTAVRFATALAERLGCTVGELPLTFALAWMEQKAVAVLLTLLSLGVRDIHLGPSLPAFLTPALAGRFVSEFGLRTTGDAAADLTAALERAQP